MGSGVSRPPAASALGAVARPGGAAHTDTRGKASCVAPIVLCVARTAALTLLLPRVLPRVLARVAACASRPPVRYRQRSTGTPPSPSPVGPLGGGRGEGEGEGLRLGLPAFQDGPAPVRSAMRPSATGSRRSAVEAGSISAKHSKAWRCQSRSHVSYMHMIELSNLLAWRVQRGGNRPPAGLRCTRHRGWGFARLC